MKLEKFLFFGIILLKILFSFNNVYAFDSFDIDKVEQGATINGNGITSANTAIGKVWNTILLILQILAVAAVVIAGVRYMFSSADAKADIKKQTLFLIVGAILVFAASGVITLLVNITNDITGNNVKVERDANGNITYRYSDYDGDNINDWADTTGDGCPDILNKNMPQMEDAFNRWKKDVPDETLERR